MQSLENAATPYDLGKAVGKLLELALGFVGAGVVLKVFARVKGLAKVGKAAKATEKAVPPQLTGIPKPVPQPGLAYIQTRINITKSGLDHSFGRHMNPSINASQFTISPSEVRSLLADKRIIKAPVYETGGGAFFRTVDVGYVVGTDKLNGFLDTKLLTIITDKRGNLKTVFPGEYHP